MITLQRTRLAGLQRKAAQQLRAGFGGPWWSRSSRILLLLAGFFIGSNLTVHLENATGARTFSAFFALIACELLLVLRRRSPWLDYLRLGFVYAVVLEAFKVGS
jgi:hypothetical protein